MRLFGSISPIALGQVLAIAALVGAGVFVAFSPERSGSVGFWLAIGAPNVALALVGLIRAKRDGDLRAWLVPKWGDFTLAFASTAVLFGGAVLFTKLVTAHGSPREIWLVSLYAQFGDPKVLEARALPIAAGILVMAAAEEILWRGLVTSLVAEQVGSRSAWIWAAALYAGAHVPSMWALRGPGAGLNPLLPVAALGAGLVWGGMARRLGRLTPGILGHALFDWCVLMMFPLWTGR